VGQALALSRLQPVVARGSLLDRSDDTRRIFTATTKVAAEAGLVGVRRVLDSAPLFDAVATMDTVTLIRSRIRGLLKTADAVLESRSCGGCCRGRMTIGRRADRQAIGTNAAARVELIDQLARDGMAFARGVGGPAAGRGRGAGC
jgi:hypothetical protein